MFALITEISLVGMDMRALSLDEAKQTIGQMWTSFLGDNIGMKRAVIDAIHQKLQPRHFWVIFSEAEIVSNIVHVYLHRLNAQCFIVDRSAPGMDASGSCRSSHHRTLRYAQSTEP